MTARSRHLLAEAPRQPKDSEKIDSDFVVILASLLCALICVLGLVAVVRCAWIRRFAGGGRNPAAAAAANKGVKKKVLKTLPRITYGAEDAANLSDCAICLAEFAAGEQVRVLPQCGHGFHVMCIDTWLGSHSSCPSCRQLLRPPAAARCQKCGGIQPEPRDGQVRTSSSI